MKNLFLSTITVIALAFTGFSCSSDDNNSSGKAIEYSELPTEAKNFIETYFSDSEIARVEKDINSVDEYYEVKFVGGAEIDFDESGVWMNVEGNNQPIPTGFINNSIVEYVTTNYSTTPIESIEKKSYGFDVDLINNTELRFDSEGTFLGLGN